MTALLLASHYHYEKMHFTGGSGLGILILVVLVVILFKSRNNS